MKLGCAKALDRAGFPWATSHTLRRTVATRLDDAGLSAQQIADHLGHSRPSLTQDVYLGRVTANPLTAAALQQASDLPGRALPAASCGPAALLAGLAASLTFHHTR